METNTAMLGNLKLRGHILLGYAVPIPLSFLLAWLVYSNTDLVGQSLAQANASRDALEVTDRMESEASAMERATRGYLLSGQQGHLNVFNAASKSLIEASASAEKLIKNSKQEFFNAEQKKLFDELVKTGKQLIQLDERMINLAKNGKKAEAIKLFSKDESTLLSRQMKDINNTFNDAALKQLRQTQSNTTSSLQLLTLVAVFGTLIAAIVSITFGLLLASRIQRTINKTVSAIASSSNEIVASVEQQELSATQQAAAVHETTTTMDELGASSRASAEQAEAAKVKVDRIAQQIMRLTEQLALINNIANLVSDIANQTNMLAINAAVEAVRAGENGKGFAVVATEIRRLAEQSKRSAEKINGLIADIQNTAKGSALIADWNEIGIEGIVSAVNNIAVNIQQISLNARQQAIAIQQVVNAMNDFNQSAQQTAAGINQTRVSILQLNEAANSLKSVVG